jgi:hypothetical protein
MFKLNIFNLFLIIIFLFVTIKTSESSIDLSDDNPVVYCLKAAKRLTLDEIKDYYLRSQKPESAPDYQMDDPYFLWCVEQASRED